MTETTRGFETRTGPEAIAVTDTMHPDGARKRIAWSAIFAGVVLVFAIELLLNSLGAGIGLGMVQPDTGGTPSAGSFGTGAGIWLLLSTIIAFVVSGYVAGHLAGPPSRFDGLLHGLVVWGLTMLLALYLLGSAATNLIGGAFHLAGGAASLAGKGAAAAAPQVAEAAGISPDVVQDQVQSYMGPSVTDPTQMSPQDAQKAIAKEVPNLAAGGDKAAAARQRIIPIIAAQQHVTDEEAARRFDAGQAKFNQERQVAIEKAKQAGEASAKAASKAAFLTFAALLIGAIAAGIGGAMAAPRDAMTSSRRVL